MAPALGSVAAQSSAAQARGRVPGPDLAAAEEPAPVPYMMAPEEVACALGLERPVMAAAELKLVPELVRQAARRLQVPGWEKLQVGRRP